MPDEQPPASINLNLDPKTYLQHRKLELESELKKMDLEAQRSKFEAGWIGKVLGVGDNAKTNLGLVVIVLVVAVGALVGVFAPAERLEFWKVFVLPLLTLTLGYVLGQKGRP